MKKTFLYNISLKWHMTYYMESIIDGIFEMQSHAVDVVISHVNDKELMSYDKVCTDTNIPITSSYNMSESALFTLG